MDLFLAKATAVPASPASFPTNCGSQLLKYFWVHASHNFNFHMSCSLMELDWKDCSEPWAFRQGCSDFIQEVRLTFDHMQDTEISQLVSSCSLNDVFFAIKCSVLVWVCHPGGCPALAQFSVSQTGLTLKIQTPLKQLWSRSLISFLK